MSIPYVTGTVSVANGSAVVTGAGTAWATAVLNGGLFGLDGNDGNPIPILSIDSDTQLTLAKPWRGATGAGQGYWIQRDTANGQQTVANAQALSTYLQRLDNASLSALASLAASMSADKFAYATGLNTMAWAALSTFNREMLALGDAAAVRNKIGAYSTGGGAISGNVSVNGGVTAASSFAGDGAYAVTPSGTGATLGLRTGSPLGSSTPRWQIEKSAEAESGGNAGSNFSLQRFDDGGTWRGTPLYIERKSGAVTLGDTPYMQTNMGTDFVVPVGQQVGIASGGFGFQRGGFTLGGLVNGREVVHVPLFGWYRITMTISGSSTGAASTLEFLTNGSAVHSHLVYYSAFGNGTNSFMLNIGAGTYFSFRVTGAGLSISGWNSRVTVEFISR